MILFSAEAILASSTSKFGIEIPRIDDEVLNSSTESTNSTSLRLCSLGSSRLSPSGFEGALRGEHLSIRVRSYRDQLHGPIRFPQHLFSVHDHGRNARARAAAQFPPLRWPDCTLSRLRAEEYGRPVTQSIATLEPSSRTIPTLDRTLVARWSLECVATLGSRRSCPGWAAAHLTWILTVFHQPSVVPVPRGHLPLREAGLFLLCVSLEVFCHAD